MCKVSGACVFDVVFECAWPLVWTRIDCYNCGPFYLSYMHRVEKRKSAIYNLKRRRKKRQKTTYKTPKAIKCFIWRKIWNGLKHLSRQSLLYRTSFFIAICILANDDNGPQKTRPQNSVTALVVRWNWKISPRSDSEERLNQTKAINPRPNTLLRDQENLGHIMCMYDVQFAHPKQ